MASDVNLTNSTISGFTGSGTTYTFTVTPNADGPVTVDVPAATATDIAENNNTAATQLTRTYDATAPTVALTSESPTTTNAPFLVTATFSEDVTGFDNTDITVTNATVGNFVTLDAKTYTFDVTPNADGAVTVDVLATQAYDTATNNNTAATQLVRTADVTAPTASLGAVSNIANSGGTSQTLTVSFSDTSGIDVSSLDNSDLVVNWSGGAMGVGFVRVDTNSNSTTGTATYSLTGPGGSWDDTDNGSYAVNLQASQVKDTLGNQVVGSNLGSFTVNIATPTPTPTPTLGTPAVIFLEPLGSTEVLESLGSDIYKVRLNTQPTANVTVAIIPGTQFTSLPTLTFTPENWNVAQTVTVAAVDDGVVEGNHVSPISHATTSTDTLYNNLVASVTVNISDNDNLGDVQTLFQKSVIGLTQNDDRVTGSALKDMIHARPGNDYLHGKAGDDLLYGQKGDDGISGGDGDDIIFGGQGIDFINADRGIDFIYSGKGNDRIYGGDGDDIVFGDGGNDYLCGEMGADTLTGGLGFDVFALAIGTGSTDLVAADVITDFTLNQDKIDLISPLAFNNQLNIFQGTGALVSDTIIQYQVTGEYLAILKGVSASSIVPLVSF
jgi:Ca2+-binding RTX toxin-like protein